MNERYRLCRVLSSWPNRRVLLMDDELTGRKVIAKMVSHQAPEALLHQHNQEIRILSALHSAWIPDVLDVFSDSQGNWLIEQYFDGCSLKEWLRTKPSRKSRQEIFGQIVDLCAKVHQAGYLHLDLKAENIRIHKGHACLIDFNGAALMGSRSVLMASSSTLPPEAGKQNLDWRADLLGLGSVHARMFRAGPVSRRCCREKPEERYESLRALKKAAQPVIPAKKFAPALLLALCIGLPLGDLLQGRTPEIPAVLLAAGSGSLQKVTDRDLEGLSAAQMLAQLVRKEREGLEWSDEAWKEAALCALDHHDRRLAGSLCGRIPVKAAEKMPELMSALLLLDERKTDEKLAAAGMEAVLSSENRLSARQYCLLAAAGVLNGNLSWNGTLNKNFELLLAKAEAWSTEEAVLVMQALLILQEDGFVCLPDSALEKALETSGQGRQLLSIHRRMKEWKTQ